MAIHCYGHFTWVVRRQILLWPYSLMLSQWSFWETCLKPRKLFVQLEVDLICLKLFLLGMNVSELIWSQLLLCVVVVDISVCLVTNDYRGHVRNDGDSNYTQCPGQSCSRLHLRCQSEGTNRVHQSTSSTMKRGKSSIFYYQIPSYLLDEHNENTKNLVMEDNPLGLSKPINLKGNYWREMPKSVISIKNCLPKLVPSYWCWLLAGRLRHKEILRQRSRYLLWGSLEKLDLVHLWRPASLNLDEIVASSSEIASTRQYCPTDGWQSWGQKFSSFKIIFSLKYLIDSWW